MNYVQECINDSLHLLIMSLSEKDKKQKQLYVMHKLPYSMIGVHVNSLRLVIKIKEGRHVFDH